MDAQSKSVESSVAGIGPYKATKLWNDVISAFRQGVPRGRHRRYMRTVENCFLGSTAVDWLQTYLHKYTSFGPDVNRKQTVQLLNKFYKAGIFEEVLLSRGRNKNDFSDSNRLYRLLPTSPNKGTRIPLVSQPQTSLNIQHDTVNLKTRKFEKGTKCTREDKFVLEEKGKENQTCLLNTERVKTPIQNLSSETLPQCHLVGRILTLSEISEVWKIAALSRLKKILGCSSLEDMLQGYAVDGSFIRHNCIFLNKSGIVTNISQEDHLPHWVLSAMKCLARWPEKVEGDLPSYPGFEKDVFGVVLDYFLGLPEPLISSALYDVITNVFVQAGNHLPRHSSPCHAVVKNQSGLAHSLWSATSLENVILDMTRKYCMTDSRADLYSTEHPASTFHVSDSHSSWNCKAEREVNSHHMTKSHASLSSGAKSYSNLNGMTDDHTSINCMSESQSYLYQTAQSHSNLYYTAKSNPDLHSMADSHPNLNFIEQGHLGLRCMKKNYPNSLRRPEVCADVHNQGSQHGQTEQAYYIDPKKCVSSMSLFTTQSAINGLGTSNIEKSSQQFLSSPDLQVDHYETAFGPENKTVTRVYYNNGVATDFYHSVSQGDQLAPFETHFDAVPNPCHLSHNSQPKSERVRSHSCTQPAYPKYFTGATGNSGNRINESSKVTAASKPWKDSLDTACYPSGNSTKITNLKQSTVRRRNAERYKTFGGMQFVYEHDKPQINETHKELAASMPYLPNLGVNLINTEKNTGTEEMTQHKEIIHKGLHRKSSVKRTSSLYMNFAQSGLCEERAIRALQIVCLFMPPASRRKLHFLLKLMNKMAANTRLTLDPNQSTRSLVLGTFQRAILCSSEEVDLDDVLVLQLVAFLMDHHMDILAVPTDMKNAVEDRLKLLERPQIVYSPRDPESVRFCQPVTVQQYEANKQDNSQNALADLLNSIIHDQNMAQKEKQRRLKQFQKTYPDIYRQCFPNGESAGNTKETVPKIRPPLLTKPLLKLRGLRV